MKLDKPIPANAGDAPGEKLLTSKQVAALLQITERTLKQMKKEERGPVPTYVGRLIRYTPDSVRAYINENSYRSTKK